MSEINVYDATKLELADWYELQGVKRRALKTTLNRTPEELDALVHTDDVERFAAIRSNPNSEVGRSFNAGQVYDHPRVAVATDGNKVLGFATAAHNRSGATSAELRKKRLTVVRNYLWLHEVAVIPDAQKQGVGTALAMALIKQTIPFRRVSAFIYPEEMPFLQPKLEEYGFIAGGQQAVSLAGRQAVLQQMVAPSAWAVRR